MKTSILNFLKSKTQKKLGRKISTDELKMLYVIANERTKELIIELEDEINEFVPLIQK